MKSKKEAKKSQNSKNKAQLHTDKFTKLGTWQFPKSGTQQFQNQVPTKKNKLETLCFSFSKPKTSPKKPTKTKKCT